MRFLALVTAAFIVVFAVLPEILPIQDLAAALALFAAYVAWRVRSG